MRYDHKNVQNKWYDKTATQYVINVMILSSFFSYARSEILVHKISKLKTISLGNPKILIQNFQMNKKLIKM